MIELLFGGANARRSANLGAVLEIGTGCGYQAAVLAEVSQRVISVERLKPLHDKARELLAPLRLDPPAAGVRRRHAGPSARARPTTASSRRPAASALPQAWLEQLAVGGRLVSPVEQAAGGQALVVVDRREDGYDRRVHEAVRFVPLKSGLSR